jgi:iron(III) transport system ATP-binding protein
MNVRENISYGLKIKKLAPEEIEGRVARTVSYLGIEGLLERTPGQVSGGQQQRVALARALVMEPELLLLDEPLSNLDAKLRVNIRAELRLLQQRLKITTIYVTHDQAEALALSDQIAVMNEGRIVQAGSPGEVYYRPRSAFVASFVGTANLLPADLESPRGEGLFAVVGGERLTVEPAGDFPRSGGGRLQLCIRPEAIQLLPESAGRPAGNVVRGRVKNFIFEGASLRYWIEALDQELVADVFDPGEAGIREGEVWLRLDPRKIHLIREA